MFGQVGETEFDLRFSLFGIPIRVHPAFWLIAIFMGSRTLQSPNGLWLLGIWVVCLFVSILVHELGHALVAKYFGWPPHIVLCHFGGYAAYEPFRGHTPQRSILISFAGPAAGFVLFGIVRGFREWYIQYLVETGAPVNDFAAFTILQLEHINLYWGLVNLLPVLPLDGGQICREVFKLLRFRNWMEISIKISLLISGAAAFYFFTNGQRYPGFLFAYLCFINFQSLQATRTGRGGIW